jgi:general secretion pathway protein M
MHVLSKTQQRLLAITILMVAVVSLLVIILLPIRSVNSTYAGRIDQQQELLARLEKLAAQHDTLRARHQALQQSRTGSGQTLVSDSPAMAAAELQRIVKTTTGKNAIQLMSTQILPAVEEQDFTKIALRVRIHGPLSGMVEAIYDLEAKSLFLFLDNLTMYPASTRNRLRVGAVNRPFEASFDLVAYMTELE